MDSLEKLIKAFSCPKCGKLQENPGKCGNEKCLHSQTIEISLLVADYCKEFGHRLNPQPLKVARRKGVKEVCGCVRYMEQTPSLCVICGCEVEGEWKTTGVAKCYFCRFDPDAYMT